MSSRHSYTYSHASNRFGRSVTPMGAVPISVIWGFDYPLEDQTFARATRALSEFREPMDTFHSTTTYPSFPSALSSSTSFRPSALTERTSRPPSHHYPRYSESHLHITPSVPNFTKDAMSGKVYGGATHVRYPSTRYQSRGPLRYSQYPRYRSRFYH